MCRCAAILMGYSSYCTSRPQHVCWPVLPPHSYHARVTSAVVKTSYHAFKTLHVSRGDGPAFRDARLFTFRSMETSLAKTKVKKNTAKEPKALALQSGPCLFCFLPRYLRPEWPAANCRQNKARCRSCRNLWRSTCQSFPWLWQPST